MNLTQIKVQPEYLEREEQTDLPIIAVNMDEKFPNGPENPFCNANAYASIMKSLKHCNIKIYPILREDFAKIH